MAFLAILRRSASNLLPVAARIIGTPRHRYHAAAYSAVRRGSLARQFRPSSYVSVRQFGSEKSGRDENLLKVIGSEIQCAEESDDHDGGEEIPQNFPFKIDDNPGQQTITLTREYDDETITVEVSMPDLVTGEGEENEDDEDGEETESSSQSSIPLLVQVAKKDGPFLEFDCVAYPDEISIQRLSLKNPEMEDEIAYEGPDFMDLDENLQKAFHKYLEIRGIKPSTTNFLHEYMINKDSKEYLNWLKNLKSFVEA